MTLIDLKPVLYYGHSNNLQEGVANEFWKNNLCTDNGFSSSVRISQMCQTLSWQLQSTKFFLSRSISMFGICSTYLKTQNSCLSREFTRYRIVSSANAQQDLSYGDSISNIPYYVSKSKRESKLAYPCRFRPNLNRHSKKTIFKRLFRSRFRRNGLCAQFFHDRSMPFVISLGTFSQKQRRNKTPYSFRLERPYSGLKMQNSHNNYNTTLQMPLASGTIFQVDQTAFANKAFYGTSKNTIKTQIWIAISVYVLIAIIKKQLKIEKSLYTILQILSVTVFEKVPILQALAEFNSQEKIGDSDNQLLLFDL